MSVNERPCKGCGKMILWAETRDGKRIPLDPKALVYLVTDDPLAGKIADRTVNYMVTHFATCPKANDFSASRKKPQPQELPL